MAKFSGDDADDVEGIAASEHELDEGVGSRRDATERSCSEASFALSVETFRLLLACLSCSALKLDWYRRFLMLLCFTFGISNAERNQLVGKACFGSHIGIADELNSANENARIPVRKW